MSPLSLPERHVAQAEPRKHSGLGGFINRHRNARAVCLCAAPLDAVLLGRLIVPAEKAATRRRTQYSPLARSTLTVTLNCPLDHAVSQRGEKGSGDHPWLP